MGVFRLSQSLGQTLGQTGPSTEVAAGVATLVITFAIVDPVVSLAVLAKTVVGLVSFAVVIVTHLLPGPLPGLRETNNTNYVALGGQSSPPSSAMKLIWSIFRCKSRWPRCL